MQPNYLPDQHGDLRGLRRPEKNGDGKDYTRNASPNKHPGAHVDAGLNLGNQHVAGDLHQYVAHKQADQSMVSRGRGP